MIRLKPLISTLAIAAVCFMAPAAFAATGQGSHPASIEFDLLANNGLHVHVETSGEIDLQVTRQGRSVSYEVPGESTEAGLRARFGRLGLIEVSFTPTKTTATEPPKGCTGKPSRSSEGVFEGTMRFRGERDYVQIDAVRVNGRMSVNRRWQCPQHGSSARRGDTRSPDPFGFQARSARATAALSASSSVCRCYFLATAVRDGRGLGSTNFYGLKVENRERMEITRTTSVRANPPAFVFNHANGTANVHPPLPFRGDATFESRIHGRDLWTSTIRIPLLGVDPLQIAGPSFQVKLTEDLPEDNPQ